MALLTVPALAVSLPMSCDSVGCAAPSCEVAAAAGFHVSPLFVHHGKNMVCSTLVWTREPCFCASLLKPGSFSVPLWSKEGELSL